MEGRKVEGHLAECAELAERKKRRKMMSEPEKWCSRLLGGNSPT
jgi:hypothetical protein